MLRIIQPRILALAAARRTSNAFSTQPSPSLQSATASEVSQIRQLEQSLTAEGFSEQQAKTLLEVISAAINESTASTSSSMVQKPDLEKFTRQSQQEMAKLKMDIRNLSVLEYGQLRVELKRITSEVDRLRDLVNDDVNKTHGSIRLDLNLEKKRIASEVDALDQLVLNAENKIEKEMGSLVSRIEKMRVDMKKGFTNSIAVVSVLFIGQMGYSYFFPDHPTAPPAVQEIHIVSTVPPASPQPVLLTEVPPIEGELPVKAEEKSQ